jgi:hypothetical protein
MGILFEEKELQTGTLDPDNTEYTLLDQAKINLIKAKSSIS